MNRARSLWLAAICAAALLAYARSFESPFQFDDFINIIEAPTVRSPSLATFIRSARARILPTATYMLNYRIGGNNPVGYHVVNFAVHLLATATLYGLVLALCRTPRLRGTGLASQALPMAVAAALLFSCHPIQIQAVTYVVQRAASMATLFYLASVLLYVRARNAQVGAEPGRPGPRYLGSALCGMAAFLSKENAASLPLTILLAEWTFYPGVAAGRRLLRLAPFAAMVLVIPLVWWLFGTRYRGGDTFGDQLSYFVGFLFRRARPVDQVSSLDYFFTQCTVIPRYLGLVFLPWGFNVDHDVAASGAGSLAGVSGFAVLAALLGCGLYALGRWPLLGFGIVWFFLGLSVESSVFPIQDLMVEHRMYLAMPGVAMALAVPFAWALQRWRTATLIAGTAVAAGLCALTFLRNEVWRTPVALWQDALAKSPGKSRVHANLGAALQLGGRTDEAVAHYCKALEIDPDNKRAVSNLDAAVEEQIEKDSAGGKVVMLDLMEVGPDGSVQLAPKDPCEKFRSQK